MRKAQLITQVLRRETYLSVYPPMTICVTIAKHKRVFSFFIFFEQGWFYGCQIDAGYGVTKGGGWCKSVLERLRNV
jgi:hypothetical protein